MGQLILFEIKKSIKSRKNRIVLVIYLILIASLIFTKIDQGASKRAETVKNLVFLQDYYMLDNATYGNRADLYDSPLFRAYADNAAVRAEYYGKKAQALLNRDLQAELEADIEHYTNELNFYTNTIRGIIERGELLKGLPTRFLDYPFRLLNSYDARLNIIEYYELQLDFLTSLRDKGIKPMSHYDLTGFAFLYTAFNELLPPISLLIALLVLSDIVSGESDSGSFKFLLLQPLPRWKVILAKAASAFIITLMWLLIPILVAFLFVGLMNGFGDPAYPVLYLNDTFTSLSAPSAAPNYDSTYLARDFYRFLSWERDTAYAAVEYRHGNFYLGFSKYASENGYFLVFALPNKELTLVPIGIFVLRCLIPIILYAIFAAALAVFVSTLAQKGIISIVLGTLLGMLFTIFTIQPEGIDIVTALLPITYKNPVVLLSGLGGSTALLGMIVLAVCSILLLVISGIMFKKRDIIC